MSFSLYSDGGARGNPGPAASATFLFDEGHHIVDFNGEFLTVSTNNIAEYTGLLIGLSLAKKHKVKALICYLDSELIVKQLNGEYKVRDAKLQLLYTEVINASTYFDTISFEHVRREFNKAADRLVNVILDSHEK